MLAASLVVAIVLGAIGLGVSHSLSPSIVVVPQAGLGSGKSAFITAGKCTGSKFKVKSSFVYYTGATEALSSSSKCSK